MKYLVTKSVVNVVGSIWMPAVTAAQTIELDAYALENIRGYKDAYATDWRGGLEQWLCRHAGDFQSVDDFSASLEIDGETIDIPWSSEESELTFNDCMFDDE